jgi:hypothetical protein
MVTLQPMHAHRGPILIRRKVQVSAVSQGVSVQLSTMLLALWLAISLYAALRPANRNLALAAFDSG